MEKILSASPEFTAWLKGKEVEYFAVIFEDIDNGIEKFDDGDEVLSTEDVLHFNEQLLELRLAQDLLPYELRDQIPFEIADSKWEMFVLVFKRLNEIFDNEKQLEALLNLNAS